MKASRPLTKTKLGIASPFTFDVNDQCSPNISLLRGMRRLSFRQITDVTLSTTQSCKYYLEYLEYPTSMLTTFQNPRPPGQI